MSGRDEARAGTGAAPATDAGEGAGTIYYRGERLSVCGRALRIVLWVVSRQERINATATLAGQLWVSWKGDGPHSISGDIRTPL